MHAVRREAIKGYTMIGSTCMIVPVYMHKLLAGLLCHDPANTAAGDT